MAVSSLRGFSKDSEMHVIGVGARQGGRGEKAPDTVGSHMFANGGG